MQDTEEQHFPPGHIVEFYSLQRNNYLGMSVNVLLPAQLGHGIAQDLGEYNYIGCTKPHTILVSSYQFIGGYCIFLHISRDNSSFKNMAGKNIYFSDALYTNDIFHNSF